MINEIKNHIEFKNVSLSYGNDKNAIEGISLTIKKGEFTTLLGPSGCGKTTILKLIGGFLVPTSGELLLDGEVINDKPPYLRPVNTVFQNYALFPHLNVFDNIAFGLKLQKVSKPEMKRRVEKVLDLVDLEGFEKRNITTLSGGQQQRIAIARAIINEPEVLLFDEPLSALDYKMRREMQIELKNMHKDLGITFVFVTHDQEEALTMSDKIIVMSDGEIQQVGSPEEIYNEPKNLFVADFIGDCNIFDGVVSGEREVVFGGARFKCVDDYDRESRVNVIIRPEDVEITKPGEGQIDGVVNTADFRGTFYITYVEFGNYEMEVHTLKQYFPGDKVGLSVAPDMIHLIPYDVSINRYEGTIGARSEDKVALTFGDISIEVDYRQALGDAVLNEGDKVNVFFAPDAAVLSDDLEAGLVKGKILEFYYVGDHYSYTVRSASEEDYVVNDEYLWNSDDEVSIIIPEDKLVITPVVEGSDQ